MRSALLALTSLMLACSGREPPGIGRFDAGVLFADIPMIEVGPAVMEGSTVPEFSLPDLNAASRTHGMTLTPSGLRPRVVAYYFSNAI